MLPLWAARVPTSDPVALRNPHCLVERGRGHAGGGRANCRHRRCRHHYSHRRLRLRNLKATGRVTSDQTRRRNLGSSLPRGPRQTSMHRARVRDKQSCRATLAVEG